jgi:hypothetical protein
MGVKSNIWKMSCGLAVVGVIFSIICFIFEILSLGVIVGKSGYFVER